MPDPQTNALAPVPQQQADVSQPPGPDKKQPEPYSDAKIKTWEQLATRPLAKKYGMDTIFKQKISERRSMMEGWLDRVNKGYPLEKIPQSERNAVVGMMRDRGLDPSIQNLKPEYVSGLRVLHVSLVGTKETPGLLQSLQVLDNPSSRVRIAIVPELMKARQEPEGMIGQLWTMYKSSFLHPDEKVFIRQMARALSAINSLRSVTGLPRSTQQLMNQYMLELPNVLMDTSAEQGYQRLALIHREIVAALKQGQVGEMIKEGPPPGSAATPQAGEKALGSGEVPD